MPSTDHELLGGSAVSFHQTGWTGPPLDPFHLLALFTCLLALWSCIPQCVSLSTDFIQNGDYVFSIYKSNNPLTA